MTQQAQATQVSSPEPVALPTAEDSMQRLQSLVANGGVDDNEVVDQPSEPSEEKQEAAVEVSSYDAEILEMCDQIDATELLMHGSVSFELDILEDVLSVSVQSLKKSDLREIQSDIDAYLRGSGDDDSPSPSVESLRDFSDMRHLAQGILGINGKPLPNDWEARFQLLEQLAAPAYSAIRREYVKFLEAVGLVFPDKATQSQMDRLRDAVKKARAHR
jgi:hypothetical protein